MTETSYYFFSTIPQVIGAIIALIGAFHIFRNKVTNQSLNGFAQNIITIMGEVAGEPFDNLRGRLREALISRKYQLIEPIISEIRIVLIDGYNEDTYYRILQKIDNYFETKTKLQKRSKVFTFTLLLSVFVIIVTLLELIFSSMIPDNQICYYYIGTLVLVALNLGLVYWYIRLAQ